MHLTVPNVSPSLQANFQWTVNAAALERIAHMDIFHVDLDNTLIYSYKHEIGENKRSVEVYQGREISYITERTYQLLLELKKYVCIVPTTTRTVEQYSRIELGIGNLKYALVCNGGLLLIDGQADQTWYEQSLSLVEESREELERAIRCLEQEQNRIFEIRLLEKLFVFTKCRSAQETVRRLQVQLHPRFTDVFHNGEKVYVVPKKLNKGMAVARFRDYLGSEKVYAAGDSAFDIPMLEQAELAMAPPACGYLAGRRSGCVHVMPGKRIFSEELLKFLLDTCMYI